MTGSAGTPCLDEGEVLALLAGEGDESERHAQRAHLEECHDCQELIALLESRDEPATRIDRYRVVRELGRGSMGTVFLAHDPELERPVALKVLRAHGPDVEKRMRREARSLARLSHPNVVAVFDVGVFEDRVFMAMEYVEGTSLRAWLKERPRHRDEIVASFTQAGEGLVAAHSAGIVHRDFKPDNVLVGADGRVRVVDFGLAHIDTVDEAPRGGGALPLTATIRTGGLVGTPAYMAPEQYAGKPADARSDQFSFSVSLAEALFGQRPFRGTTTEELRVRTAAGDHALPPSQRDPVTKVLERGLRPQPDDRYPTMRGLLSELNAPRPRRRAWRWVAAATAACVALLAATPWLAARIALARATREAPTPSQVLARTVAPTSPSVGVPRELPTTAPLEHNATPAPSEAPVAETHAERVKTHPSPPHRAGRSTPTPTVPSATAVPLGANDTPLIE